MYIRKCIKSHSLRCSKALFAFILLFTLEFVNWFSFWACTFHAYSVQWIHITWKLCTNSVLKLKSQMITVDFTHGYTEIPHELNPLDTVVMSKTSYSRLILRIHTKNPHETSAFNNVHAISFYYHCHGLAHFACGHLLSTILLCHISFYSIVLVCPLFLWINVYSMELICLTQWQRIACRTMNLMGQLFFIGLFAMG